LQSVAGFPVHWLGLDNGYLEIPSKAEQIIGTLLFSAFGLISYYYDSPVREILLLCKRMGLIIPARLDKPGLYIFSAGIRFIQLGFHFVFLPPSPCPLPFENLQGSEVATSISIYHNL
jgi:hypothetical protein